jgi:hypothetical protein
VGIETPRGELGTYLIAGGGKMGDTPYRLKIRPPSLHALAVRALRLPGTLRQRRRRHPGQPRPDHGRGGPMTDTLKELLLNPVIRALFWGLVMVTAVMTVTAWTTWFERKFAGRMQSRMGPTLVGPAGLLQPLADAAKLLQKEDLIPDSADRFLFNLAPILTVGFALGVAAVVPFTPDMLAADLDVGVLWLLALSGLMVFPTWMGSWASNNKYSLISAMRAGRPGHLVRGSDGAGDHGAGDHDRHAEPERHRRRPGQRTAGSSTACPSPASSPF